MIGALWLASFWFGEDVLNVGIAGSLRQMMHAGVTEGQISLSEIKQLPNLIALGAAEHLRGEILVVDGKALTASVENGEVRIRQDWRQKAALLVYGSVPEWTVIQTPTDLAGLDQALQQWRKQHQLGERPLAFRLTGTAPALDWHVLDTPAPDAPATHQAHRQAGLNGRMQNVAVDIIGFYSTGHHGVFTHRDSNLHMHVITADGGLVAHVDGLTLGSDLKLQVGVPTLPAND